MGRASIFTELMQGCQLHECYGNPKPDPDPASFVWQMLVALAGLTGLLAVITW